MPARRLDRSDELTDLMPALLRAARRMVDGRDAAEDLVQEGLLRVWARLDKGAQIEDLAPYLRATMRNIVRRRRTDAPLELIEEAIPGEPGAAGGRLATADVLAAIDRLPEPQAALLRALMVHEESYEALAARLDLPIGTVMSRLSRARAALRLQMDLPDGRSTDALLDGGD